MNGSEIIAFLENNFATISSTVGAVVGGLFTAIFLRSNTSMQEFEKIKAGQFKDVADDLLASGKMTYTEYYKAKNFLAVAEKADEYYSKMPQKEKVDRYDFDWFIRFYESVGNISDEEMQDLWAKILAGEICKPLTYSLRTIDVLKNLSKADAELFEEVCAHSIFSDGIWFLPRYQNYLDSAGIIYLKIMQLCELGLLYNSDSIVFNIKRTANEDVLLVFKDLVLTYDSNDENLSGFTIEHYPFTQVGKEIASLRELFANEERFLIFANEVKKSAPKARIEVHRITSRNDNGIEYDDKDLLLMR